MRGGWEDTTASPLAAVAAVAAGSARGTMSMRKSNTSSAATADATSDFCTVLRLLTSVLRQQVDELGVVIARNQETKHPTSNRDRQVATRNNYHIQAR